MVLSQNPNPLGVDGTAVKSILDDLQNSLVTILLEILVQIFYVFLKFVSMLLQGYYVSSPAIYFIAFMFIVTAYIGIKARS